MKFKIILVIIYVSFYTLSAQNKKLDESLITGESETIKDTLVHKYKFFVGDTLEYRIESADSIVINWDSPLLKERYEMIRIVCDSVSKETGHFFLSHEYINYIGYEDKSLYKPVERDYHPWLNKKVIIEYDSLGKRYSFKYTDTTTLATSAGGPFQPMAILPIGKLKSTEGRTWLVQKDTIHLAENGYTPPVLIWTNLFENKGTKDTLGYSNVRVDFTTTGVGTVYIVNYEAEFYMTTVINGYGENNISRELMVPTWVYFTQEQKFTFENDNGKETKGYHSNYSIFQLDRFVPGKGRK